jgi:Zn-dependent membrane protease YugP
MNQSEEILQSVGEMTEYAKQFTKDQVRYIKLEVAERMAKVVSELATSIALVFVGLIVAFFLSLTIGIWLGELLNSFVAGFGIITICYLIIGCLIVVFKQKIITNPVISLIVEKMLD